MDKTVKYSFIVFLVVGLLIAPLRSGYFEFGPFSGLTLSSITGFVVLYTLTLYFLYKKNSLWVVVAAFTGMFFFTLPLHLLYFEDTLLTKLEVAIHLLAIISAYICRQWRRAIIKCVFSVIILIAAYFLSTSGYRMWIHYLNFQTIDGETTKERVPTVVYFQREKDSISNLEFQKELILLDFWSTHCGACYRAFPVLQRLSTTCSNKKIELYAVFVGYKNETYLTGDSIMRKRGYKMPMLFLKDNAPALSYLKITHYPTVVILNKKGEILFRGEIENAGDFVNSYFLSHDKK